MNTTTAPTQTTRIEADALHQFAQATACAVGIPASQAVLLADLLTAADLRANKTHGTRQLTRYVNEITSDRLNPTPMITTVKETPVSLVLDGDGGLGYFPAHAGTLRIIEKAQTSGMAALVCRHHGHIGAAGHYPRLTLGHDLICFCTSGHQLNLEPGRSAHAAAGGSPMAFSAPADREPPLVLDIGVTHGIQGSSPGRDTILATDPAVVLRAIGLGTICQAWGGLLSGLSLEVPKDRRYSRGQSGHVPLRLPRRSVPRPRGVPPQDRPLSAEGATARAPAPCRGRAPARRPRGPA